MQIRIRFIISKTKKLIYSFHFAVQPPSITIEEPVIIDEASEAKKVIEVATSLTVTTLLIGVFSLTYLLYFLSAKYFLVL